MSSIAPILEHSTGKIRFVVDNVQPAIERLPAISARLQFEQILTTPLLAFSHDDTFESIANRDIHPLAFAVHSAFSEHRPLVLTPDIIWLTIAQGFAHHLNNHAEKFRSNFVSHQGKEQLVISGNNLPTSPAQWAEIVEQWTLHLRDRVGADVYQLIECNFSTTTQITRIASHVVMMDAFKQYFDYVVRCVCGIPEISLLGTVADWQRIYDRVVNLSEYDLGWWTDRLLPICQEFINTAAGKPDLDFWQCIYKPKEVYASELMTGWLVDLFPYFRDSLTKEPTYRNCLLEIERYYSFEPTDRQTPVRSFERNRSGVALVCLPLGISQIGFELNYQQAERAMNVDLELMAGFIGVRQDSHGKLQPEIGWGVRVKNNRLSQLLDRLQQEHPTEPPLDWMNCAIDEIPHELVEMSERFDGAKLYADSQHSWHILPVQLWEQNWVDDLILPEIFCYFYAYPFIALNDGRSIAYNFNYDSQQCSFLVGNQVDNKFESYTIVATSATELFERILAADGAYYFDDPSFLA